jgi:hypothetical protein
MTEQVRMFSMSMVSKSDQGLEGHIVMLPF